MKSLKKGPITSMRTNYFLLPIECQQRIRKFNIIHANLLIKTRMLFVKNCLNRSNIFSKVNQYSSLKLFLNSLTCENNDLQQRIIGLIPSDIHDVYIEEKDVKSN